MTERLRKSFVVRGPEVLDRVVAFVRNNATPERPLSVLVSEADSKRTLDQNAFLFAMLREIAANAWISGKKYDAETWFEFFARRFGEVQEKVLPSGEIIIVRRSTTEMGIKRFAEFTENIRLYAMEELGLELNQ